MKIIISFLWLCVSSVIYADTSIIWQLGADNKIVTPFIKDKAMASKNRKGIVQLVYQTHIDIYADKVVNHIRKAWLYNDAEAIQNYGTDSIYFDELSESLTIREAAIIRSAGDIIRFDPKTSQILDPDTVQVFTNTKELVIPYSGIEVGSIAVLDYEIVSNKNNQETDWSKVNYPQLLFPRDKFELTVNWHDDIKPMWSADSQYASCTNTKNSLLCHGDNIPAAISDNQVQWYDQLGQIIVGEIDNWELIINKETLAFNSSIQNDSELDPVLESLIQNTDTLEQKIAAIHQFVTKKIRYISYSEQGHSVTPHSVSETLSKRYGDCKDKSALLQALLKRISIPAYPVLIATNRTDPEVLKIPSMNYFDHVIICFAYQGQTKCLDPTDVYSRWESTSSWIQGKVALPLLPNQTPTTIKQDKYRWKTSVDTKITFLKTGGIKEHQQRKHSSAYASWYRGTLTQKNAKDRNRWLIEQYTGQIAADAKPVFSFTGVDEMTPQVTILSNTEYDSFQDINKDLFYILKFRSSFYPLIQAPLLIYNASSRSVFKSS